MTTNVHPETLESEKMEIAKYIGDQYWRLNNLYYILDKDGHEILFKMNGSQEKFYWDMWYMNLILKDRQRGFSTLIAIYILDTCLFNDGTAAGIVDITLPDAKKKLAKISYAYERIPDFLKQTVPLTTDAKEAIEFANGSSIYAATSHRGGTLQILHISEMGKIAVRFPERAREIRTGALNTLKAGNIIFNESTAEGNAGEFYEDCQSARVIAETGAKLTALDYRFHFFGWWEGSENEMDPDGVFISPEVDKYCDDLEKNLAIQINSRKRAWYMKKSTQQKDDMQREFPGTPDEAFAAAIEGVYLSKALKHLREHGQICDLPIDKQYPLNTGWDYGLSDHMTIWIHQRVGFVERLVGYMSGADDDVLYYWAELQKRYSSFTWGYHFLPHDFGHQRGGTAKDSASPPRTLQQILIADGMSDSFIIPRIDHKGTAINEVKIWLPSAYVDPKKCAEGVKCLMNFRREWDDVNGCWKERPRHDWAMHGYDGLETLVRGINAYGCKGKIGDKSGETYYSRKRIG